jgi:release factor glutamine methyltransferase
MSKHPDEETGARADDEARNARRGDAPTRGDGGGAQSETTVARALAEAAKLLREGGVDDPRREAATLLAGLMGRDRAYLFAHSDDALAPEDSSALRAHAARRAAGEPLQYVLGRQEFYGLEFEVTPAVLIPRPETELLVEWALELLRGTDSPSLCDVGTGSGCVAVSVLRERADARGVGCDISAEALHVATRNAKRHGVSDRLWFCVSDCFSFWGEGPDVTRPRFHMIVSNPPYVAERDLPGLQREVREHEPRAALTPGGDGLSVIRRLLRDSPRYLRAGGHLLFEIGFDQHEAVRALIDPRVWETLGIRSDLQGIPRAVALRRKD